MCNMVEKEKIIKRLDDAFQLLKSKGIASTKTAMAEIMGVDKNYLIAAFNPKNKNGTKSLLLRVADSFPDVINREYMETGEGNVALPEISYSDGVPYYDVDFKLGFEEMINPDTRVPEYLIRMPGYEKATMWCNVMGHSMEPEISSGDLIALQLIEDFSFLLFGDVYGFITTNGMRTIKRLGKSSKEGFYRLVPTNPEYDEQEIPINIIACVYRVMGTMKAF